MTEPEKPDEPDDWWWFGDPAEGPAPSELTVYPSEVEPAPALYGPTGDVIRWRAPWPVGFCSAKETP